MQEWERELEHIMQRLPQEQLEENQKTGSMSFFVHTKIEDLFACLSSSLSRGPDEFDWAGALLLLFLFFLHPLSPPPPPLFFFFFFVHPTFCRAWWWSRRWRRGRYYAWLTPTVLNNGMPCHAMPYEYVCKTCTHARWGEESGSLGARSLPRLLRFLNSLFRSYSFLSFCV